MVSQMQSHLPLKQRLMLVPQGSNSSSGWHHIPASANEDEVSLPEDSQQRHGVISQPLRRQSYWQRQNNVRQQQQHGYYHQKSSSDYSVMLQAVSTVLPSLFEATPSSSSSSACVSTPLEVYEHHALNHKNLPVSRGNSSNINRSFHHQQQGRLPPPSMIPGVAAFQQTRTENVTNGNVFRDHRYYKHQQDQQEQPQHSYTKQSDFFANSPKRRSVDSLHTGNTRMGYSGGKNIKPSLLLGLKNPQQHQLQQSSQQQLSASSTATQVVRSLAHVPGFYLLPSSGTDAPRLIGTPGAGAPAYQYQSPAHANSVSSSVVGVPLHSHTSIHTHHEEITTDPFYHPKSSFTNRRQQSFMSDVVQHQQQHSNRSSNHSSSNNNSYNNSNRSNNSNNNSNANNNNNSNTNSINNRNNNSNVNNCRNVNNTSNISNNGNVNSNNSTNNSSSNDNDNLKVVNNTNGTKRYVSKLQTQQQLTYNETRKTTMEPTVSLSEDKSVNVISNRLKSDKHNDFKIFNPQKDTSWKNFLTNSNSKHTGTTSAAGSGKSLMGSSDSQSRLLLNRARWLMSRDMYRPEFMYCTSRRLRKRFASWSPRSNRLPAAASKATWWLTLALRKVAAANDCKDKSSLFTESFLQEARHLLSSNRTSKQRTSHKVRITDAPLRSVGLDITTKASVSTKELESKMAHKKVSALFDVDEQNKGSQRRPALPSELSLPSSSERNNSSEVVAESKQEESEITSFGGDKNKNYNQQLSTRESCLNNDILKSSPPAATTTSSSVTASKAVLSSSSPSSSASTFPNLEPAETSVQVEGNGNLSCARSAAGPTPSVAPTGPISIVTDTLTCGSSCIDNNRNDQTTTRSSTTKHRDSEHSNTTSSSPLCDSGKYSSSSEPFALVPSSLYQQPGQIFTPYIIDSRCFTNADNNTLRNSAVGTTATTGPPILVFTNSGHFDPNNHTSNSQPLVSAQPSLPSVSNILAKSLCDAEGADKQSQTTNPYAMDVCCFIPSSASNGVLPPTLQQGSPQSFMTGNTSLSTSTTVVGVATAAVPAAPAYTASGGFVPLPYNQTASRLLTCHTMPYWNEKQVDDGVSNTDATFSLSFPNDVATPLFSRFIVAHGMKPSSTARFINTRSLNTSSGYFPQSASTCLGSASGCYGQSIESDKTLPSSTPTVLASKFVLPSPSDFNSSSAQNYSHGSFYRHNSSEVHPRENTPFSVASHKKLEIMEDAQPAHHSSSSAVSSFHVQDCFPVESTSTEAIQADPRYWTKNKAASHSINQPGSIPSQTEKGAQSKKQQQRQTQNATWGSSDTAAVKTQNNYAATELMSPACYFSTWYCAPQSNSPDLNALSRSISNSICHFMSSVDQELATKTCPFRDKIISSLREEILHFLSRSPVVAKYMPPRNTNKRACGTMPLDVIVYGSCSTNLSLPWSDIDLTIMGLQLDSNATNNSLYGGTFSGNIQRESNSSIVDPRHEILEHLSSYFSPVSTDPENNQKQQKNSNLRCRTEIIRYFSCQKLKPSRHTPILTLQLNPTSTSSLEIVNHVDVSIHDAKHTGLGAIRILKFYLTFFPTMRPLILILKQVLMRRNMNVPYEGGLSSYALSLMVVAFLQSVELYGCRVFDVGYQLLNLLAFYGDIPVPSEGVVNLKPVKFNHAPSIPITDYVSTPTASRDDSTGASKITPMNSISSFNYYDVGIVTMAPEAFLQSESCSRLLRLMNESYVRNTEKKQEPQYKTGQQNIKEAVKKVSVPPSEASKEEEFLSPSSHEKVTDQSFGPTLGAGPAPAGSQCVDGTLKRSYAAVLAMSCNATEKKNNRAYTLAGSSSEQLKADSTVPSHEGSSSIKTRESWQDVSVDNVNFDYSDEQERQSVSAITEQRTQAKNNQMGEKNINFVNIPNGNSNSGGGLPPLSLEVHPWKTPPKRQQSQSESNLSRQKNSTYNCGEDATVEASYSFGCGKFSNVKDSDTVLDEAVGIASTAADLTTANLNKPGSHPLETTEKSISANSAARQSSPPPSSHSNINENSYSEVFQLLSPYLRDDHFFGKRLDIRDPVNAVNNVGRPCWNVSGIKVVFAHAFRDLLTIPKCYYCAESYHLNTSPWTHKIGLQHDSSTFFTGTTWWKNLNRLTKEMNKFYPTHVSLPPSPVLVPVTLSDSCSCKNILKMIL